MNSSTFQTTAILGSHPAGWGSTQPTLGDRAMLGLGGTLAVMGAGLGIVAALGAGAPVISASIACAITGGLLLRSVGLREHQRSMDEGLLDTPSGLYNVHGLIRVGAAMLERCRSERRPLGLVVLDFTDLPEVRDIYGREVSRKLQGHVVRRMKALAGRKGLCARTGRTEFTVLLPGATREQLQAIIQRQLGKPSRIEFDAGDSEIVLVPDILFDSAADDLESVGELYRDVATQLAQAQAVEQRRQVWLTRERERHSRPMSLPPSTH